jgi:short-subunit dehydrogenase
VVRVRGAAVVISGASSGIGAATALAFAKRRARLALGARRLDRLQAVAERCRLAGAADVLIRRVDVSRAADARALVDSSSQHFEGIDVLVNNAGVGWRGPLQEMPEADVEQLLATNLAACVWTTQAALPVMLEASSGVIINVASVLGLRAMPYSALYSASKYALVGLSHALRGELSGTGVRVCVVYPGTTDTEFQRGRKPDGLIVHSPGWVAEAIVRAARWPRRDVVVLPYRVAQFVEPVFGGLLDHVLGEVRRRQHGEYRT